jgi:hypothetical protein
LDEMESCIKATVTTASAAQTEVPPPGTPAARSTTAMRAVAPAPDLSPPPSPAASSRRRALAWTLGGSAAALLASSAVFGVLAWDARGDAEGTPWQRPAVDANDRYRLDTAVAWSFAVSGLACGVISYLVGRRP